MSKPLSMTPELLYRDPDRLEEYMRSMTWTSLQTAKELARQFPWDNYKTFLDIGCAEGALPVQLLLHHKHLRGIGFDLPPVAPIFNRYLRSHGLASRVNFIGGDFFHESLPSADVFIMGNVLLCWTLEEQKILLSKAYNTLPVRGALIIYDQTEVDGLALLKEAGFQEIQFHELRGSAKMFVGIK